jgi:hypothetical protein
VFLPPGTGLVYQLGTLSLQTSTSDRGVSLAESYRGTDCYAHSYINYCDRNADGHADADAYPHSNANCYGNIGVVAERSQTSMRGGAPIALAVLAALLWLSRER